MRVHFIIHEPFEAPGTYQTWARSRGYAITHSRMYAYEQLPEDIDAIDMLVIMGGPQSPATTKEECPSFDAAAECACIARAIKAKKLVIGVCLGAQLVGETLGGRFEHSPEKEIGKFPIFLTEAGKNDPLFSLFGDSLDVGHWHSDMPGLTDAAIVIAKSGGCPRQIIRYQDFVYGFQCHMKFTTEVVRGLVQASRDELSASASLRFVQPVETLLTQDYQEMNQKLYHFLDALTTEYQRRTT
jgi:GMP synthase (glutamine-hydrolysing)